MMIVVYASTDVAGTASVDFDCVVSMADAISPETFISVAFWVSINAEAIRGDSIFANLSIVADVATFTLEPKQVHIRHVGHVEFYSLFIDLQLKLIPNGRSILHRSHLPFFSVKLLTLKNPIGKDLLLRSIAQMPKVISPYPFRKAIFILSLLDISDLFIMLVHITV